MMYLHTRQRVPWCNGLYEYGKHILASGVAVVRVKLDSMGVQSHCSNNGNHRDDDDDDDYFNYGIITQYYTMIFPKISIMHS